MRPAPFAVAGQNPYQHPVLRVGVTVGAGLCALFLAWLLVANHVQFLDRFAVLRNFITIGVATVLLLVPICRFPRSPGRLFVSALIGWTMLSLVYSATAVRFPVLADRLGAFHLFVLGTTAYGLLATVLWVGRCVLYACQHPIAARRRIP